LPFAVIMILLLVGLIRQMNADLAGEPVTTRSAPIAERLKHILAPPRRSEIERQLAKEGAPALVSVRDALVNDQNLPALVAQEPAAARLTVPLFDGRPFEYELSAAARPLPAFSPLEAPEGRRSQEWRLVARVSGFPRARDVTGFTRDQLIGDVLDQLDQWRRVQS
jgi:choline/glycine/proline betaine transport protein